MTKEGLKVMVRYMASVILLAVILFFVIVFFSTLPPDTWHSSVNTMESRPAMQQLQKDALK